MPDAYYVETPDGHKVPLDVPDGASADQVKMLAVRALKQKFPDAKYQRPVLSQETLRAVGRAPDLSKQGSISAYEPHLSEKLGNFIGDTLAKMGVNERHAARLANKITGALYDLSPTGNIDDFLYGDSDLQRQLAILPLPGPIKREAQEAIRTGIRAWHGSPHDFDKFSLSKIGTGEGAQAYGHGLYFAENRDVADAYREQLGRVSMGRAVNGKQLTYGSPDWVAADLASMARGNEADIIKDYGSVENWARADLAARGFGDQQKQILKRFNEFSAQDVTTPYHKGRLYEVNINANPEDFLDWDSSITDLSKASPRDRLVDDYKAAMLGRHLGETPDINSMNAELLRQGIPGIRYLDQGSRNALSGTRNYVVFDDSLIDIISKDGIPVRSALGGY